MIDDSMFEGLNAAPAEPAIEIETPASEPVAPIIAEPIEVATPVEAVKEDRTVPLPTFLDQRDELKEAKRRIAEFEAQQAAPSQVPDPFDDPQGFANHSRQEFNQALLGQKFSMSGVMARKEFGDETVQTAVAWADAKAEADPAFKATILGNQHPIDWIVRQHKRDAVVSQLGDDPDDFVRRRAAELGLTAPMATAPVVVPQQQAPTPPRSLAATPSTIGGVSHVPLDPLGALNAVFK